MMASTGTGGPRDKSSHEYLEKHGVTAYLKDMITVMLENRPEKPLEFVADYLTNALQVSLCFACNLTIVPKEDLTATRAGEHSKVLDAAILGRGLLRAL